MTENGFRRIEVDAPSVLGNLMIHLARALSRRRLVAFNVPLYGRLQKLHFIQ